MKPFETFTNFSYFRLKQVFNWQHVNKGLKCITDIRSDININDSELQNEFAYLKEHIAEERVKKWNSENTPIDLRWCETFSHLQKCFVSYNNFLKLISAIFCLPGSNAPTERVFSIINNIWIEEKTSLSLSTLKAIMIVRVNLNYSCVEFYDKITKDEKIHEAIHSFIKHKDYQP